MNRRDFLINTYRVGGLIALYRLGLSTVEAFGIKHIALLGTSTDTSNEAVTSWSGWSESSEASLASSNTFVCFFEGGAGANETGQGGNLSGADLVLTQTGDVPAASGTPPYRQLTYASHQYFNAAAAIPSLIENQAEWTIVLKIADWSTYDDLVCILDWQADLRCMRAADKLRFIYKTSDVTSTDTITTSGSLYFAAWRKNGAVKAGWTTGTRPTTEADFASTKLCESTDDNQATNLSYGYIGTDTGRFITAKLYYLVVSKTALFS